MKNYLESVGFKRQATGGAFGGATTGQGVDAAQGIQEKLLQKYGVKK